MDIIGDWNEIHRWGENSKVYERRFRNKRLKKTVILDSEVTTAEENNDNQRGEGNEKNQENGILATEDTNLLQEKDSGSHLNSISDDLSGQDQSLQLAVENNGHEQLNRNGSPKPIHRKVDGRVRINLATERSKDEIRELKHKLVDELDQVRSLVQKLDAKKIQLTSYTVNNGNHNGRFIHSENGGGLSHSHNPINESRVLARMDSVVGSVGHYDSRPFQHLSIQMSDNNYDPSELAEKEKRTPKANQYYRSSEFLLAKDRLPPAESNKKLKPNGGRKLGGDMGYGFVMNKYTNQALKSCNSLLARLMRHKFAWVFNKPVDAKALGLHDYHYVIRNPMDLGTIKSRLAKNWYKSPREFAEDVRLTFHNAMIYNPKGQDVHIMAEQLLNVFEDKWVAIESEYNYDLRYGLVHDTILPTPPSRKVHPPPPPLPYRPPALDMRVLERSESMTMPLDYKLKPHTPVGRTPVPKKPKAKDTNKRDMTYDEKQRLSTHLQNMPSEKLDAIVQIIKKGSSTLSQHDDEIEVDIDSVDTETLWELDRFVTNYKKNLSKKKRRAEIALQARAEARPAVSAMNNAPATAQAKKEFKKDETNVMTYPVPGERPGDNGGVSSSSSSSSSDSDSDSSDSDSDSSSGSGSDAGHSPKN